MFTTLQMKNSWLEKHLSNHYGNIDKFSLQTYQYYIDSEALTRTNQHLYLGVLFHSSMSFSPHINNITSSAIKSLNIVRRNLNKCDESVQPKLEYASSVWDPHLSKDIQAIERVQRIAARWVKSNYNWENSVTSMLSELQWPALNIRRRISRLTILYHGLHNLISLEIPTYITTTTHLTRFQIPFHFNIPTARSNHYHNSYFLKTFRDWNLLPIPAIEASTLNCFTINYVLSYLLLIISNCNIRIVTCCFNICTITRLFVISS